MKVMTSYSVKIKEYRTIFKETIDIYRKCVDYLIAVCLNEWENIFQINVSKFQMNFVEHLIHKTNDNPNPKYNNFDILFYKMPSYIRRAAIMEAIGKVSSYKSNLDNWKSNPVGKEPSIPKAGYIYPTLYRDNMYIQTNKYEARIKVYRNNTWDWLTVNLRKSDMDYISRRCNGRKMCAPTLQKRGKCWYLNFPFEEKVALPTTPINEQLVVAVDLGINSSAVCTVMSSKGTIYGRHFCNLSSEQDSLTHSINRIKKAQQHGNHKTPKLWAKTKGINNNIAVKTAHFIMNVTVMYNADVIVFEHLNLNGKKKGSKKQKLHMWKARYIQSMVTNKAHRLGIRISHIIVWGTSKLAFDGSGHVLRGKDAGFNTYSLCQFSNGKTYNCDLNASYNIGARYFIREILKSVPVRVRLQLEANVPQVCKRSTCTLSTLIKLNAVLSAQAA